ncbi:DUF3289 family protein [Brenneria izadpanahii]|uniref:DUF3289 family protein n=1 Tax=Brenneria izadpanahii TaxID=2722756 RepID=A0ABX7UU16_9GAMM|nr:DUF3289 family protein [Brenneria izadpanahii]QTF08386.1 DUF3289 family protein [Brenneria izadpanahii]
MIITRFPQTIYTTQKSFNDYGANDMRYGDISEDRLKGEFGLTNVSNVVDPYTLTRLTAFDNPQSRFAGVYGGVHRGNAVSIQECARLLFEEMQATSLLYSFYGPYKYLINQMLKHFQRKSGTPFTDMQLNAAYRERIISDNSSKSTKLAIQEVIDLFIDYDNRGYPQDKLNKLDSAIRDTILPKFDSFIFDKINGMGITVHDVHATKIDILSLDVGERSWKARVKFIGQDHFGLDVDDIRKQKFNQFQFFKIWFVLQRFNKFGFHPFLTNMEAVINIEGGL